MSAPEVSVLVPTHNAPRYCRKLLSSIRLTQDVPYELVVVDNASRRATKAYLQAMSRLGRLDKLLLNDRNLLFAAANNQAARVAHPESRYLLLLNSDVEITHPAWLRLLLAAHRRGATGYGAIEDAAGVRADGYCLLVDRDLYDRYQLDERYAWWWCSSKLQAQLLHAGHAVRAIRHHDALLVHHWAKSGNDYLGAQGMEIDPATVRGWFGDLEAEVLDRLATPA